MIAFFIFGISTLECSICKSGLKRGLKRGELIHIYLWYRSDITSKHWWRWWWSLSCIETSIVMISLRRILFLRTAHIYVVWHYLLSYQESSTTAQAVTQLTRTATLVLVRTDRWVPFSTRRKSFSDCAGRSTD